MNASWSAILGSVLASLVVVPAVLTYWLLVHGPPTGVGSVVLGTVAMLPGFLMGATALLVAARDPPG